MYGQIPNPMIFAAKWVFFGFLGIVLMAVFLGANIKDATWLNPEIASAEAKRINVESTYQQAVNELQVQLAQAKTDAEIQKIRREQELLDAKYDHDIQALTQDLEHSDIAFKTWMNIITFLGGALAIAILLVAVLWGGSKALANIRPVAPSPQPIQTVARAVVKEEPYNPWNSPAYRYQKRVAAQRAEYKSHVSEIAARMKPFKDPTRISKEEYKKGPLAG